MEIPFGHTVAYGVLVNGQVLPLQYREETANRRCIPSRNAVDEMNKRHYICFGEECWRPNETQKGMSGSQIGSTSPPTGWLRNIDLIHETISVSGFYWHLRGRKPAARPPIRD